MLKTATSGQGANTFLGLPEQRTQQAFVGRFEIPQDGEGSLAGHCGDGRRGCIRICY